MCDQDLVELEPPQSKRDEYAEMAQSVNKIVVAGNKKVGASSLFANARDITTVDPYKLQ